ncbi:hypothetical protein SUGI_0191770 [Cryptomeria japonica]|nr:hypothetical protein SUGI_0191770 [Cryptomeria japonica]
MASLVCSWSTSNQQPTMWHQIPPLQAFDVSGNGQNNILRHHGITSMLLVYLKPATHNMASNPPLCKHLMSLETTGRIIFSDTMASLVCSWSTSNQQPTMWHQIPNPAPEKNLKPIPKAMAAANHYTRPSKLYVDV